MRSRDELSVLLVSDIAGKDDEGMKKIARMLDISLNKRTGIVSRIVSIRDAIQSVKKADIMHYIGGPTFRSVFFTAWCKILNKQARTILTFSNPQWNWIADSAIGFFSPDCVIVSSKYWQDWAKKKGLHSEFIAISGVDLRRFVPVTDDEQVMLRRKLGLPLNKLIVLHVGHLKEDRNLLVLLNVQTDPEIQVVVVGSTTTKQSDELVRDLEAANCIVVRSYQPKIEAFYQAADCYVFPTVDHRAAVQIPLSILEAMAANLPVVTSRFGGLMDFFPPSKGLTYFSVDEFMDLAEIVKSIVSESIDTNSHIQSFSWDRISERLHKIYLNLNGVVT